MGKWKYLFWIDLEASGSDQEKDPIMEAAWRITEREAPFNVLLSNSCIIDPELGDISANGEWIQRMKDTPEEVVFKMHTETGLLRDISEGEGISAVDAQALIIADLDSIGSKHDYLIAGSGVSHYDRRMIATQWPKVDKWLQYPSLDVGNVRRAFEMVPGGLEFADVAFGSTRTATGGVRHRADADIDDHIGEWRIYAEFLAEAVLAMKERRIPGIPPIILSAAPDYFEAAGAV